MRGMETRPYRHEIVGAAGDLWGLVALVDDVAAGRHARERRHDDQNSYGRRLLRPAAGHQGERRSSRRVLWRVSCDTGAVTIQFHADLAMHLCYIYTSLSLVLSFAVFRLFFARIGIILFIYHQRVVVEYTNLAN